MNLEEINAHLELDYPTGVLIGVLTWLASNYVRTQYPQKDTYFPKHDPEDILRSKALDGIMDGDYIKSEDLNTLAGAMFGVDEHGNYYAKRNLKNRRPRQETMFPYTAKLDFENALQDTRTTIRKGSFY